MQDFNTLVSTVAGLSITGVTRQFTYRPASLGTADLPASFVDLPGGAYEQIFTCANENMTRTIQLVVAVEPVGQGTESQNYDLTVDMLDNVVTAINGVSKATWAGLLGYSLSTSPPMAIGGSFYWSIIATISVTG